MKRNPSKQEAESDRDTMRPEYDFSGGVRWMTAARFRIDPEILGVFLDGQSVNEALRALADVIRRGRERKSA